jgi:hypothetical protein
LRKVSVGKDTGEATIELLTFCHLNIFRLRQFCVLFAVEIYLGQESVFHYLNTGGGVSGQDPGIRSWPSAKEYVCNEKKTILKSMRLRSSLDQDFAAKMNMCKLLLPRLHPSKSHHINVYTVQYCKVVHIMTRIFFCLL